MQPGPVETATVLFTDVVASTATRSRLRDEAADARLVELERVAGQAVTQAGGTLVKGLGDGIMATFASVTAALDAAVIIQRATRRLRRRRPASALSVRVGISSGDVLRDGDDCFGTAVVEASRLCGEADGGDVLVGDAAAYLVRGRSGHVLRPLGGRRLKGFSADLDVFQLVWDTEPEGQLPPKLAQVAVMPLQGRAVELARASEALAGVQSGGSAALFLAGEPGVGKTRLAAAIAEAASGLGFTVVHGTCEEGLAAPYQPIVEALGGWLAECPDGALGTFVSSAGSELVRLWPQLADRGAGLGTPGPVDPDLGRWRLHEAVESLVRSIAADSTLLVVVDDLHWAEPATLLLVNHLVRAGVPRLALVVTARPGGALGDRPGSLSEVGPGVKVELIGLEGLSGDDVAALVARHDDRLPPDLVAWIQEATGGNPFFVLMLVAHLQDLHLLRTADGGWARPSDLAAVPVPDTVRHVMARRLRVLTPASRDVLAAAAVVSRDVDVGFLARVAGLAIDDAVGEVDRVVAAGLVKERDDGTVGLAHALVRQSVIDELSKTRLARLHWRVGEELERLPAEAVSVDELAAHYRAGASVGDQAAVVRTSLAALDQALAQTAFEQAAEHARATLVALDRVVGRADHRFRALLGLGQALNLLGRSEEARVPLLEAAEIAKGLGDAEGLLTTLEAYCFVLRLGERDPVHLRIVDDIVSLLPEGDSPLRARVTGWRAGLLLDAGADPTSTLAMATDALAIARRTGDAGALISTCASITYVAAASAHAAQALRLLDAVGPPPAHMATTRFDTLAHVRLGRAQLRLRLGRRDGIEAELDELGAQARERGLGLLHNNTLLLRGALAAAEGRFAEAKHLAATARDAAGPPTLLVSLGWGAQLTTTRLEQGRAAEVVSMLDTIDNLPGVAPAAVAAWRAMRAGAMAQAGDHRRAGDELTAMAADGFGQFPRDQSFPLALRHLCELCRALGRPDEARMLLPEVSAYAGQILLGFLGTSLEGGANRSVGHLLATLGQHDEADRAYTAASRLERNAGFAPFTARTGYWHALVLLERDGPGDRERADHLLADTIDTANALGMALLHEHAHSLRARL